MASQFFLGKFCLESEILRNSKMHNGIGTLQHNKFSLNKIKHMQNKGCIHSSNYFNTVKTCATKFVAKKELDVTIIPKLPTVAVVPHADV